jgi:aspartate/methionine/tyrosine aminotransferase
LLFICHSPLTLAIVGSFIKLSQWKGLESIWSISQGNRALLRKSITDTNLRAVGYPNSSVEWLRIEDGMDDMDMMNFLQSHDVYVLPGRNFFWSHPRVSSQYIRVALMRDPSFFAKAMSRLQQILQTKIPPGLYGARLCSPAAAVSASLPGAGSRQQRA